jgi:hypothetical protein
MIFISRKIGKSNNKRDRYAKKKKEKEIPQDDSNFVSFFCFMHGRRWYPSRRLNLHGLNNASSQKDHEWEKA